jgi:hypothetical protein
MRLSAGHGLNLERAEHFITQLAASSDDLVEIDLSECRHIDPGAGWRVGNALRPAHANADITVYMPERESAFSGLWFHLFTKSGLGHAIARHADRVLVAEADITAELRTYYAQPRRQGIAIKGLEHALWASPNFIYISHIADAVLDPDNLDQFEQRLSATFSTVDLQPPAYGHLLTPGDIPSVLSPVVQLLFEAVQNCYDHCRRKPLVNGASVSSYLSMQYHNRINNPRSVSPELPAYFGRVQTLIKDHPLAYTGAFLELGVNDDGVGIPARHSQRPDIAQHAYGLERDIVLAAINTRASVKLDSRDTPVRGDPGYGFLKIRDALTQLHAFALVRTGRVLAYFDSTAERSIDARASAGLFHALETPLGSMPGTSFQVFFPHRSLNLFSPQP